MKSLKSNLILVPKLLTKLKRDYGFIPYIGVEVEFYLKNQSYGELNENEQQHFFDILQNKNIKLTGEKGQDQFEFELGPSASILNLIQEIITWRQFIKDVAYENQLLANFKPKPFLNSYGSAMHFNISLQNKTGETVFSEGNNTHNNKYVQYIIGGILSLLNQSLYYIMGNDRNEYLRITPRFMAPVNLSWGGNNRTTAIRIPDSNKSNRRIEFRVPSANCNPGKVIIFLLTAILYGLDNKKEMPLRIYGNAHHKIYKIKKLHDNVEKAMQDYMFDEILAKYVMQ